MIGDQHYKRFRGIWTGMRHRTSNPNSYAYADYGGRGIMLCKRWQTFSNFERDMFNSYKKHCKERGEKNTSINRIDPNGPYSPENCAWATFKEQAMAKFKRPRKQSGLAGLCTQCSHCIKIIKLFGITSEELKDL